MHGETVKLCFCQPGGDGGGALLGIFFIGKMACSGEWDEFCAGDVAGEARGCFEGDDEVSGTP